MELFVEGETWKSLIFCKATVAVVNRYLNNIFRAKNPFYLS